MENVVKVDNFIDPISSSVHTIPLIDNFIRWIDRRYIVLKAGIKFPLEVCSTKDGKEYEEQ